MAQIAGLSDSRKHGEPADIGTFQFTATAIVFKFTFSGTEYTVAIAAGVGGWRRIAESPSGADDVEINAAIVYAFGVGGGLVYICGGTYDIATSVLMYPRIMLSGAGIDATTLFLGANVDDDVIKYEGAGPVYWCVIQNMTISANKANNVAGRGIHINNQFNDGLIENVFVVNASEEGIYLENVWGWRVRDSIIEFCEGDGVAFTGGHHGKLEYCKLSANEGNGAMIAVYGCTVQGNDVDSNGINGLRFLTSYILCVNNVVYSNTTNGILFETTIYCKVNDNNCYTNGNHGIFLMDADYCTVENNTCVENDSGDTATYDGIFVDADSTGNALLGNVCVKNHRQGITIYGAGNVVNSNVIAENDKYGIIIYASDCKVNDNRVYHNGADGDNVYDGINLQGPADRCTVNGNTIYSDGTRQRSGIHLANGTTDCIMNGNICYLNATDGINLVANNNDCVITGNHCLTNGAYGINIAAASCLRNRVKDNILRLNGTAPFQDLGTDTQLETIPITLVQGTTFISAAGEAWGWEINLADEFALGVSLLPLEVQQVVRIKITGVALADPGAGNKMRAQFTGEAATFHEPFATHPIDVVDKDCEEEDPDIGDVIHWVLTSADDGDIANILGGDRLQLKVLHEGAGGGSIATDAIIDTIQVEIV